MKHFILLLTLLFFYPLLGEKTWQMSEGEFSAFITQSHEVLNSLENLKISLKLRYPEGYQVNPEALTANLLQNNTALPAPFTLISVDKKTQKNETTLNYILSPEWEGKFHLSFYAINFFETKDKTKKPITIISEVFPVQVDIETKNIPTTFEPAPLMTFSTKIPIKVDDQNKKEIESLVSKEIENNQSLIENSQRLGKILSTLLFLGLFILWVKYNKGSHKPSKEEKITTTRLKAIESLKLLEKQNIEGQIAPKALYTGLSTTIRSYLEDRYELEARAKTTEEFFEDSNIQQLQKIVSVVELKDFLTASDKVKFAKLQPSKEDFQSAVHAFKHFIDKDEA